MARKRIIDPEFWSDEEIGFWSFQARLFYIGLWNFADDEGRLKAHPALLKSQIFPYELKINMELLKKEVGCKVRWYSINGQEYGHISNFLKHQRIDRPTPSKLPSPHQLDESLTRPLGDVLPNTTKDNISKDKLSKPPAFDFESIWGKYPRKLGKDEALRKFNKQVVSDIDFSNIKKALDNFLKSKVCGGDPQYIPYGSTWFNEKWRDWIEYKHNTEHKKDERSQWKLKANKDCSHCRGEGAIYAPGSGEFGKCGCVK